VSTTEIAHVLLFDRAGRLLIYLRDNNPTIPFPNHWDLFGGHVEPDETPEQAMVREVREELGIELKSWRRFTDFNCPSGDAYPNVKHIFWAVTDYTAADLILREGQELRSITMAERKHIKFANILSTVVDAFVDAGLWPRPPEKV
jgi:8-oxo-dGTP diphosphatase